MAENTASPLLPQQQQTLPATGVIAMGGGSPILRSSTPICIGGGSGDAENSGPIGNDCSPMINALPIQISSSVPSSVVANQGFGTQCSTPSLNLAAFSYAQPQFFHLQPSITGSPGGTILPPSSAMSTSGGSGLGSANITPPNSAGIRQTTALELRLLRQRSFKLLMPRIPSNDSFGHCSDPSSPGLANWATDYRDKYDSAPQTDKTPTETSKLSRKESYKAQRKNYRREKKRVASELLNSLQDPAVVVLADWLKVRGTLKSWTKLWCVLKPGLMLLYKSVKAKSSHWVGTILLTSCQVIERPSKKNGFCFKLFHPLEQSIWAPKGPDKETIGAVVQPLPTSYLIFRAPSQAAGKCWMDALELSLRCSSLLLRSNSSCGGTPVQYNNATTTETSISHETQWSEADYEKHFNDQDLDGDSQNEAPAGVLSGLDTETESDANEGPTPVAEEQTTMPPADKQELETEYVPSPEELVTVTGEQVEELAEEHKSLIWILVKQVRPGMDLSKVVLPTFILEPRSFLDKLSDSYFHADIISRAVLEDDPFTRIKLITQWYLSGFYKKPKGLKKPYNPILGETFRCYWLHPNESRTYYIAEQVSHHPPISAFYVTNRQDGFCISCAILAKSKFYGNSTSAVLEGVATLTLLPRGETYTLNTPYAHCKGILMGTLSMELGGKVCIDCENTGYKTELEFKLKPFLGGADYTNQVTGKIRLAKEVLANINGYWDGEMKIKDVKTGEQSILFAANAETKSQRLTRYLVPLEKQLPNESERLWNEVSEAIKSDDQAGATQKKSILEETQRQEAKQRKAQLIEWQPVHFYQDALSGKWLYKYADLRPWDMRNDLRQYEANYKVTTKTRHLAPTIGTPTVISTAPLQIRKDSVRPILIAKRTTHYEPDSESSQSDVEVDEKDNTQVERSDDTSLPRNSKSMNRLMQSIDQVNRSLDENMRQLLLINAKLERLQYAPAQVQSSSSFIASGLNLVEDSRPNENTHRILMYIVTGFLISYFLKWLFY